MPRPCPAVPLRRVLGAAALYTLILSSVSRPLGSGGLRAAEPADAMALYKAEPGPWSVEVLDKEWLDDARQRTVPVRIYLPQPPADAADKSLPARFPVVVFSHGWGASRASYGYFCRHLASHGYLVVSPTHAGSDTASIRIGGTGFLGGRGADQPAATQPVGRKEGIMESIQDPDNLRNRPRDVSFVLDRIGRSQSLHDLADLSRVGVAGHSFGAYTAMTEGGMTVDLPEGKAQSLRDPRVKAVIPMSPEGRGMMGISPNAWDKFATPVLFLTGTKDYGSGPHAADWRHQAFDKIHTADAYLVTIDGATHFTFAFPGSGAGGGPLQGGGRGGGGGGLPQGGGGVLQGGAAGAATARADDAAAASPDGKLIDALGTAFFDAKLRGDAQAAAWLAAYFAARHPAAAAEFKPGPAAK
jgi:predicted dienelactone hydrolase